MLNTIFHSKPVYDEKYIKGRVKKFNGVVNTIFWNDKIPKENVQCTCIAVINIDSSVMKMDKKNYPQVYLEECKYEIKKKKTVEFIDVELDLDSNESDDSDDFNSNFDLINIFYAEICFLALESFYPVVHILREQKKFSVFLF